MSEDTQDIASAVEAIPVYANAVVNETVTKPIMEEANKVAKEVAAAIHPAHGIVAEIEAKIASLDATIRADLSALVVKLKSVL